MATKVKEVPEVAANGNGTEETAGNYIFGMAHKVLRAYIGAVALARDEVEEFVNKLVERGEVAEKDGRKLVEDIMEKGRKQVGLTDDDVSHRVEETLDRMSVPTKADINALGDKIAELAAKVDALKKTKV